MQKTTLITGGAGYIGSHTALSLIDAGHHVVVLDNLCNSCHESIERLEHLTHTRIEFVEGDIRDTPLLEAIFSHYDIEAVVHFAGLKSVANSVCQPLDYYANNVVGTLNLCQIMARFNVFNLVFSSSATVYGDPPKTPIVEDCGTGTPASPYGRSKLMVEQLLTDLALSEPRWSIALLRYFNPIGAHESGLIGEDPNGKPNNLLPCLTQVAIGRIPQLTVFGNDYPTFDGTCVRDYIHVVDLAEGHLKALQVLREDHGIHIWNLGTGIGYSVLQIIRSFEDVTGITIPYQVAPRRAGDIAQCWADASKAQRDLGWCARRNLAQMILDSWRWQSSNPFGYRHQAELLTAIAR
ncbi:UDP-glucose 4-epimerase GalE [Pseudomonas vancouverensis]|uniref:UDP-glucose 4-epimerase n=1 Tax=Pseudomonas vancouverensis TaxID=95300 RepID=A0A1H2NF08_PSEVA|nr:UDP-glucose 4-epimerase GalE [Pseudomonas vancouverensis]KAB0494289.1 UDP-glucose 4-epimerase GalE [Pseudomonas vancouverensis]TDB60597.1 UDP-glucose 4-epimerase GalE [Pseudomonas vancouverensis]SDV04067.1 UDP-galactose 4-epimerase [Pseudomonas vancouverensis]